MKCHPLRWIWGLIPVALFSWLAGYDIQEQVESDLTKRSLEALHGSNLGWAKVQFDGRDGVLSGEAPEESEPGKAIQIATAIDGVRVLDGQADLLRKVEPYTWTATHRDGRVILAGFVPNEKTRKTILTAAKSAFPKSEIEDKLELARGNPPIPDWLEGIRFDLKELAALKAGKAELTGMHTSLEGEALSTAAYKDVKTALSTGLPKVLRLGTDKVTPPVVAPYDWKAKLTSNQVVLSGYVPNERAHIELLTLAKRAFGKTTVVDKIELGEGAPDDFEKAAHVSLDQLAMLQEGSAELKGSEMSLQGLAADEAVAEATRKSFKAGAPGSFKVSEAIKGLRAVVSPYVTKVAASPGAVELTGFVPSEAARSALEAAAKARFPGHAVRDRLQVAGGEPSGYDSCLSSALMGLARLGSGQIELVDRAVEISGKTQDEALAQNLPGEVKAEAKGACETKVNIALDDSARHRSAEEMAERAKREAEQAADAKREAERADVAKRLAAAEEARKTAAERESKAAASACEGDLRSAANSGTMTFERASDVISRQSRPTLRKLAAVAQACNNVLIEIEGHTDSEGIPERNQPLSERRAQAVADFLVEQGLDPARIKAVGYGDTRPIAPNDTPENKAKNRRIEFSVKTQ